MLVLKDLDVHGPVLRVHAPVLRVRVRACAWCDLSFFP
jgi:hypothetical protein